MGGVIAGVPAGTRVNVGATGEVRTVPCDPEQLVIAVTEADAEGGGSLELAPECVYTLSAAFVDPTGNNGSRRQTDGNNNGLGPDNEDTPDTFERDDKSGLPVIHHPINIDGAGATITRAASAETFRFFTVYDGGELRLSDITLENGRASQGGAIRVAHGGTAIIDRTTITHSTALSAGLEGGGGAIFIDGYATVTNSTFTHNSAAKGGGVLNGGILTLEKSEFTDNTAGVFGGGFANYRGAADVVGSTFTHNQAGQGGGIASFNSRTKVWSTEVIGNTADIGGGIANKDADLTMRELTISGNTSVTAGGGISNVQGLVTLDDSAVDDNATDGDGGGIFAQRAILTVRTSEVNGNQAKGVVRIVRDQQVGTFSKGGAIHAEKSQVSLFKSEVSGNKSTQDPGGISAKDGNVTIDDATIIADNPHCANSPEEIGKCPS